MTTEQAIVRIKKGMKSCFAYRDEEEPIVSGLVRLGEKAEENRAKPQCRCVCCVEVEE